LGTLLEVKALQELSSTQDYPVYPRSSKESQPFFTERNIASVREPTPNL
jgi:hypothetical protein